MKESKSSKKTFWGLGSIFGLSLVTAAAWIVYSRRYIDHHAKVRGVLGGEEGDFESGTAGKIHYFVNPGGRERPLLVVHGIHSAAGSHDIAPIFNAFRTHRSVYAIDLPGFGRSEKGDRPYRPSLFQTAVLDFIKGKIGEACDVVALGIGCEYVAAAAITAPEWIHSLVLVNPTGFQMTQTGSLREKPFWSSIQDLVYMLLAVPLWSLPVFDLMTNRARLTLHYQKRFEFNVPDELVSVAYASAHQPGAHFAPMVYAAGKLSNPLIREKVYDSVTVPVLVIFDNESGLCFDMLPFMTNTHPNWQAKRIRQSRGMPHFDRPGETFHSMDDFWKAQADKAA